MMRFQAVLFDLDGTLVDSAPDLAGAANELRAEQGQAPLPYDAWRVMAGAGARGMIGVGFGLKPGDEGYAPLRDRFLQLYKQRLLHSSRVFDEVEALLGAIERTGCPWGVVTNKALHLADPLLAGLGLRQRAAVLVGGDSTPHTKPHPAPVLLAVHQLGLDPRHCVYVGDDHRDVQAGLAAGTATVAAAWGYLGQGEPINEWCADHVATSPTGLLNWLELT